MANVKITDLAALTNPASTDVLPIVDVGADVTKKISIADLLENAGSGTASAPGIAFDGDSNTGIYRPGADQVAISTNGTGRLFVDASGQVGINSAPQSAFGLRVSPVTGQTNALVSLVAGTNSATSRIDFGDSDAIDVGRIIYNHSNDSFELRTNGGPGVFIDSSGNIAFGSGGASDDNTYIGHPTGDTITITTNGSEAARIDSSRRLLIGTSTVTASKTDEPGKLVVKEDTASAIVKLQGNENAQGAAQRYTIVRHYPVVSLGTKLIIPFVSQGNLNSTTTCKVWGHSARYNSSQPYAFEITFAVGHTTSLVNLASWGGQGNYASIAVNGMNIEISFATAYTSATADGIFATIEFMTNQAEYSIDVANIAMN